MKLFERSLQAVETLHTVMTTANDTFKAEQKKALDTLKNPTEVIKQLRNVLTTTEAEQKQIFRTTVRNDFAEVREKVKKVVTAPAPADFSATLEAITAAGDSITEYEAAAFLEKYKSSNYLAFRTLADVLHRAGRAKDVYVVKPDAISEKIDEGETLLLNWCQNYSGGSYMTALLRNHTNPVTMLSDYVQPFLDGRYTQEDEAE